MRLMRGGTAAQRMSHEADEVRGGTAAQRMGREADEVRGGQLLRG